MYIYTKMINGVEILENISFIQKFTSYVRTCKYFIFRQFWLYVGSNKKYNNISSEPTKINNL